MTAGKGGTSDNLDLSDLDLVELEALKSEFKLDEVRDRLTKAIKSNIPITNIGGVVDENYWLAWVIKIIETGRPGERMRALTMLGMYLNILSGNSQKHEHRQVVFKESREGK